MTNLIAWFARNTVAANLLMIGIIVSGFLSYLTMGKEVFPTIPVNYMQINVSWPGASPEEVEEQVILRIEEAVIDLQDIDSIQSRASEGFASITIESNPKVDMNDFLAEVKTRMDGIRGLPRDIEPPRVERLKAEDNLMGVVIYGFADEKVLKDIAKEARDQLGTLPGAADIQTNGARNEEVSIELSEVNMQRYGLTFDEVAAAIRRSSVDLSGGTIKTDTGEIKLRAKNRADNQTDFSEIILRQTADGGTIRVGDVATVIDGFEDIEFIARMDGYPAIMLLIKSSEGMNVVETSAAVHKWVEEYKKDLPEGVNAILWWDSSEAYTGRLETISGSAMLGLLLVFIVLILTLRPKVAFWVTAGIFTAYAGAFIFLPSNGVTLNVLSLFGFLLVLGVVVDDAIVVGENIHTESHNDNGGSVESAILGTQLVAKPVFFAVLTTMIAFLPWLLLSGVEAQFTRHITITIIGALTFSLVEAFFILPAHLSNLKPRENLHKFSKMQKKIADGIVNFAQNTYRPFAFKVVKFRYLTAAVFSVGFLLAITLVASGWVKFSFMPEIENDGMRVNVTMPTGTSFERATQVWQQIENAGLTIDPHFADRNESDENLMLHYFGFVRPTQIFAYYDMQSGNTRTVSIKELGDYFRSAIGDIPDAEEVQIRTSFNNSDPSLTFSIYADNAEDLKSAVDDLHEKLLTYDLVYQVTNSMQPANDELHIELLPGAEKLGLTLDTVSRQVRQAYYGEEVQRIAREGGDAKVMVRYPREMRRSLDSLQNMRLRTPSGEEVALFSVVNLALKPGVDRINRRDRKRNATVTAGLPDEAREDIRKDLNDNFFKDWQKNHPNVSRSLTGQAEGQAEFLQEVTSLYIMALFAMYAAIAIAFRSYFLPLVVMVAIPFAFMGAVFGHMIWGIKLALFSFFGIAAAIGVVVNDNLVLVDHALRLKAKGMDAYNAAVESATARFRPILLTTVTTVIGLIPMMIDDSLQIQDLKPTVISLSFGVFFAFFVTLFLVPAIYGIAEDIRKFFSRWWTGLKSDITYDKNKEIKPTIDYQKARPVTESSKDS